MTTSSSPPLFNRHLKNGATLAAYDQSQRLAGDRWLVSLRCEVEVRVQDEFWLQVGPVEADLGARIRAKIGNTLRHLVEQQRTFVAEADKPKVMASLLEGLETSALQYFETPDFPARLFAKRFAEFKEQCLADDRNLPAEQTTEEDGPTDFSHCFAD